jgi:hypothetical protein
MVLREVRYGKPVVQIVRPNGLNLRSDAA